MTVLGIIPVWIDEVYIQRGCSVLEGILYLLSLLVLLCSMHQCDCWKYLDSCSCPDSSKGNSSSALEHPYRVQITLHSTRSMSFWRCGRAVKTYVLSRINPPQETIRWQLLGTLWSTMRILQPAGHSLNQMMWLQLICWNITIATTFCMPRTSLETD